MMNNIEPDCAMAYNYCGLFNFKIELSLEQALSDFTKAIEKDSSYAPAYNNRAIFYAMYGKMSKALSDYEKTYQLAPNNTDITNNLERHRSKYGRIVPPTLNLPK
jgi:lipoprotein NlpI